jgi:hypothetical protein
MDKEVVNTEEFRSRTRSAYVATRVLDTPFWAIYNMLPVILYKDLHATSFQITAVIILKPLVSLLSMYWSAAINKRRDRLVPNILWARLLGYLPFFFFPFIDNCWFFIFALGLYMLLAVGIVPAWMEVLKLNIPDKTREKVFSYSQAFAYTGGSLLPFALGWLLDGYFQAWRWMFPVTSSIALLAFFFQWRILIPDENPTTRETEQKTYSEISFTKQLLMPWTNAWEVVKNKPGFRRFQLGFMILGSGLMIITPALPIFLVDTLKLSYTEIAIALAVCKGLGFAAASPFWSKWIHLVDIYKLTAFVAIMGCLFPLALSLADVHLSLVYVGYIFYGFMQSGNELIWNMSGPFFAQKEDSSTYTSVNILAIGLRGCFIPALGSFLLVAFGASSVMALSCLFYLTAFTLLMSYSKKNQSERAIFTTQ